MAKLLLVIRACCFYAAIGIMAIVLSPVVMLLAPFSYRLCLAVAKTWPSFALYCLRLFCNLDYRISGNIHNEPAIYVCSHQSAWECIALIAFLPHPCFVIKRELLWIPFWGWAFACMKPIAINRSEKTRALRQLADKSREKLAEGESIIIFPEGTRCPPGECGQMYSSYAMIATGNGYPVVPVAHNSGWFWRRREFIKRPGTIDIVFGEPIATRDKKKSQVAAETEAWLRQKVPSLPRP